VSDTELRDQLQANLSDSYTLERELGGGGMSRVFTAEERALGRRVVVKVLSPDLAAGVSAVGAIATLLLLPAHPGAPTGATVPTGGRVALGEEA